MQNYPEILLVEDNDDDAEIVSSVFARNNINPAIKRTRTGEEALDYLQQKGKYLNTGGVKAPRLVLLDINLPKLNGIETLRRMRAHPATAHTPVFIFTSSSNDHNAFESYKLGIT